MSKYSHIMANDQVELSLQQVMHRVGNKRGYVMGICAVENG